MRKISLIITFVLLFALTSGIAEVEMNYSMIGTPGRIFNAQDGAALTIEPSADSQLIASIPENAQVTIIGETDNGYGYVNYEGQSGFVPFENLDIGMTSGGLSIKSQLSDADWKAINAYLSVFTQAHLGYYYTGGVFKAAEASDAQLVEFYIEYMWFNAYESVEWGEYEQDTNARISDKGAAELLEKYFGRTGVDVSQTLYCKWMDGWYYFQETGGRMSGPFALSDNVIDFQNGTFGVYFCTYGPAEAWDEQSLSLTQQEAQNRYPYGQGYGYAIIEAEDISDPDGYRLVELVLS